jgi:hypothetical protein
LFILSKHIEEELIMASRSNRVLVPQAKAGLNRFKEEIASEIGLTNYANIDKGNLTSRENGSVGGFMVKRMVEAYEKNL